MSFLPAISGHQARKAFEQAGWVFQRQRGSHMIFSKEGVENILSIPNHRNLKKPLLKRLIKDSGLSDTEFKNLL